MSAGLAKEAGAAFSIVGHSERRADQRETDADVKGKAEAARRAGLSAILCVGETLAERDAGRAEAVVTGQIGGVAARQARRRTGSASPTSRCGRSAPGGRRRWPTWRRCTARSAAKLRELIGDEADAVRLLYGGSVTADNARELLGAGDVDGALVGGASLTAAKFVPIITAAAAL